MRGFIIRGVSLLDLETRLAPTGDVATMEDRIFAAGVVEGQGREIDATGLTVVPGGGPR
ncbi:hypothetical protein [Roseomonas sp. KE2513]|uniref:hypothetical protein n=1 Tax=Roseomonas sp. KE2513 TaxID=2479202 RepID=UPI0018E01A63|nr:hypothetical protein [Roseomonas sp. KE2513]